MTLLARLIEILEDKSSRFARSGQGKSWAEFSTTEIANFWLLHTVNSALAPLRHQYLTRRGHPEALYVEMLKLGGALCTFAFESHPRDLPLYDHRNLSKSFDLLDDAYSRASGNHRADAVHQYPAGEARRLFLRGRGEGSAGAGQGALDFRGAEQDQRAGSDRADAADREIVFEGISCRNW